jgi:hypothetical protein
MKKPLILIVSDHMDSNRKDSRNEHGLIRMGQKARNNLGLANDKTVELWPNNNSDGDRINRSKVLEIFKAYSSDIQKIKRDMPHGEQVRAGFVTSKTFAYICKDQRKKKDSIWIADGIEDTFIGGDPEFALFTDNGKIRYASEVLSFGSDLGSDGPLAELRPEPAIEVKKFVDRIKKMLKSHPSTDNIQDYEWKSGCIYKAVRAGTGVVMDWPIGGHIHIGTPLRLAKKIESLNNSSQNKGDLYQQAVFSCLNKAIDEMVAIPMIKVDGKEPAIKRRNGPGGYGTFGCYKRDRGRLEYRTISGEWLSHPKMAAAVLGTAKAIAHSFFVLMEDRNFDENAIMTNSQLKTFSNSGHFKRLEHFESSFTGWKDIRVMEDLGTILDSSKMINILHKVEIEFNKDYYTKLSRMLKSLPTYSQYSKHIDFFLEMVALPYESFKTMDRNLKRTWIKKSAFII